MILPQLSRDPAADALFDRIFREGEEAIRQYWRHQEARFAATLVHEARPSSPAQALREDPEAAWERAFTKGPFGYR